MAFSLFNEAKYGIGWTLKGQSGLTVEDLSLIEKQAKVVKSNFGRSLCFFGKNSAYTQYVPLNENSSMEIGRYYNASDIVIQELEKEGKTIFRALLKDEI